MRVKLRIVCDGEPGESWSGVEATITSSLELFDTLMRLENLTCLRYIMPLFRDPSTPYEQRGPLIFLAHRDIVPPYPEWGELFHPSELACPDSLEQLAVRVWERVEQLDSMLYHYPARGTLPTSKSV